MLKFGFIKMKYLNEEMIQIIGKLKYGVDPFFPGNLAVEEV